jgi:hypothetical protein
MWIRWIRNTGRYRIFCGHMKRRPQLDRNDYVIVTNRRNFGQTFYYLGTVYGMRVHVVPAAGPDPTP